MLLPTAAAQQTPADEQREHGASEADAMRSRLLFVLGSYHGTSSGEALVEVGPTEQVARALRELCADTGLRPSLRVRAVDGLAHFPEPRTVQLLKDIVDDPRESLGVSRRATAERLQRHAMLSYARIGGEGAVERLEPFLEADDLQLRLSAVEAIGRFGGQAGRLRLERFGAQVEHPVVQRKIEQFTAGSPP